MSNSKISLTGLGVGFFILVMVVPSAATWTDVQMIGTSYPCPCRYPSLAVASDGTVHLAWTSATGDCGQLKIYYRRFTPGVGWGAVELVSTESTENAQLPSLAVDALGTVHIIWEDRSDINGAGTDVDIFYKNKTFGGSWSSVEVVSVDTDMNSYGTTLHGPSLAVAPDGTAHVAWAQLLPDDECEIYYRQRDTGGSWSAPQTISAVDGHGSDSPSLFVPSDGSVHAVWYGSGISYRRKASGGSWQSIEVVPIEAGELSAGDGGKPVLCYDSSSVVHLAWSGGAGYGASGADLDILYKKRLPNGTWTATEIVSTESDKNSNDPAIAVHSDGRVHIVWSDRDSQFGAHWDIYYKNLPSSGVWPEYTERISYDFICEEGHYPCIGIDASGVVHVAWNDTTTDYHIMSILYMNRPDDLTSAPTITTGPEGPASTYVNVEENYLFRAHDYDYWNLSVYFWIDWGDGTNTEWSGPYLATNYPIYLTHAWEQTGLYDVRAKAKDVYNNESDWTPPLTVTVDISPSAPDPPATPDGPDTGLKHITYSYSTSTTDPDSSQVYYLFDWGDGDYSNWVGPYPVGVDCSADHAWTSPGVYAVRAKARDDDINVSQWSTPISVTIQNQPPQTPQIPAGPTDCISNVSYLYTTATTDPDGDLVYYQFDSDVSGIPIYKDIWFGPYPSDQQISVGLYWPLAGDYQLWVRAKDEHGALSSWSEPLLVAVTSHAPETPSTPSGPTFGYTTTSYTYSTSTTDADNDLVYYRFSWGDGAISDWLGPYPWWEPTCQASHAWTAPGFYDVRAQAKDANNAESDWSDALTVEIIIQPTLTIISPNGGEHLRAGRSYNIRWSHTGYISDVLVVVSMNDGLSWTAVSPPNQGNTHVYEWMVPTGLSWDQWRICVSDSTNPSVFDLSDNTFIVYECQLTADLDDDCWCMFSDLLLFVQQWLAVGCSEPDWCGLADINHDTWVDWDDFKYLAEEWLCCGDPFLADCACKTPWPETWNWPTQCHGDADGNGYVDNDDYAILVLSFNRSYPDPLYNPAADFNKDGEVGNSDLSILTSYFGYYPPADCKRGGVWPPL